MAQHPLLVSDLVAAADRVAPFDLAEPWDNVGLQFGHPDRECLPVLVALEVTREVLAEADAAGARSIATHHPLLFKPPRSFVETSYSTELAAEVIRRRLALVALHTNYDSIADGTNGELADRLGMKQDGRLFLRPVAPRGDSVKYVVFVPATHVDAVIDAAAGAGAGVIGNYSHCTFRTPGTGTFKPLEGASPHVGSVGKLEQADDEVRLEVVCSRRRLGALIQAVEAVHPYEEVAFDIHALEPRPEPRAGLGLVGGLEAPTTLGALAETARERVGCAHPAIVGDPAKPLRTIALCSGSGGDFIRAWRPGAADVFVTGEMSHHDCIEASHRGIAVLLVGHWESEVIAVPRMARQLAAALGGELGRDVIAATSEKTSPLTRL